MTQGFIFFFVSNEIFPFYLCVFSFCSRKKSHNLFRLLHSHVYIRLIVLIKILCNYHYFLDPLIESALIGKFENRLCYSLYLLSLSLLMFDLREFPSASPVVFP
jgi:hypothetical protein